MRKRELVALLLFLPSKCLVIVVWPLLTVPWACLQLWLWYFLIILTIFELRELLYVKVSEYDAYIMTCNSIDTMKVIKNVK